MLDALSEEAEDALLMKVLTSKEIVRTKPDMTTGLVSVSLAS
jgi:hypothetical protein